MKHNYFLVALLLVFCSILVNCNLQFDDEDLLNSEGDAFALSTTCPGSANSGLCSKLMASCRVIFTSAFNVFYSSRNINRPSAGICTPSKPACPQGYLYNAGSGKCEAPVVEAICNGYLNGGLCYPYCPNGYQIFTTQYDPTTKTQLEICYYK